MLPLISRGEQSDTTRHDTVVGVHVRERLAWSAIFSSFHLAFSLERGFQGQDMTITSMSRVLVWIKPGKVANPARGQHKPSTNGPKGKRKERRVSRRASANVLGAGGMDRSYPLE